jgi:hypothetical protein
MPDVAAVFLRWMPASACWEQSRAAVGAVAQPSSIAAAFTCSAAVIACAGLTVIRRRLAPE